ncbi:S24 family peptidase [Marinobacter salsuginis]|uniref:S24 family peptidase n=1 Tax=Marinobacter salsuginis TaxID=418719 RepID=UPI001AE01D71|nr:helix-turn-helix transcriptional regulator [Marinobacter salsuginis]QTN41700.1 helix-turn-helix transcriptional regulator [Marinobacter salsuginis]
MISCLQYLPKGNYFVNPQDIYQRVTVKYSCGMDIHEVRRENLARLIKDLFDGKQRRLADAIDRQPDYVSRILSGKKNVGEVFARHIEAALGLDRGSMDNLIVIDSEAHRAASSSDENSLSEVVEYASKGHGRFSLTGTPAKKVSPKPQKSQDELEFFGHMDAWDSNTPLDEDEVELPLFREVELAAGAGQTQVIENHGAKLRFAKSTLSRAGVVEENAACAFVRGNSMEPVMPDGTCVGVNTGDTAVRDGEIYAIDHDGMLRIKYLHRRPGGGIKIVSQNASEHATEEYSAQDVVDNNIRIIGRVFWWSVLR